MPEDPEPTIPPPNEGIELTLNDAAMRLIALSIVAPRFGSMDTAKSVAEEVVRWAKGEAEE